MPSILGRNVVFGPASEPAGPCLAELFHENTKLHRDAPLGGLVPGAYGEDETGAMLGGGRRHERLPRVALPAAEPTPDAMTLDQVMATRRTVRSFAAAPVPLPALATLLQLTGGITARVDTDGGWQRALRAAPSAGALYPIELFLGIRRVEGLAPGTYHYEPRAHALSELRAGDPTPALARACHYADALAGAALVVVFVGVQERTRRKYGDRGYRYVLLEAGHVAQNLGLAATALGLGCMNVCGFFDDALHDWLRLDGVDETALYVAYVGIPAEGPP